MPSFMIIISPKFFKIESNPTATNHRTKKIGGYWIKRVHIMLCIMKEQFVCLSTHPWNEDASYRSQIKLVILHDLIIPSQLPQTHTTIHSKMQSND